MERSKLILLFFAIFCIAILEIFAMWRGIDGRSLAIAMCVIALLSPSPLFQLRFGQYEVKKGKVEEDALPEKRD